MKRFIKFLWIFTMGYTVGSFTKKNKADKAWIKNFVNDEWHKNR